VVLVANKVDLRLPGQGVPAEDVRRSLARRPQWRFVECSAKENLNVREVFRVVGGLLRAVEKEKERTAQTHRLKIDPSKLRKNSDSSCC
jgi:GTPase SAR1 family protein